MRDGRTPAKRRVDYRPPAFLVPAVALEFDLAPENTRVTATFAFRRNPAASATEVRSPLVLDGESQSDVEVLLDGVALQAPRITLGDHTLTLNDPPHEGTLTVRSAHSPAQNLELEGLYISSGVFCTQCEPEGFRRITYFPDRPDVLAVYTVTLRANRARYPVLLSNGNLVEHGELEGGRHFAKWHDPYPKPSYLFALVAGELAELTETFTTASGRNVRLSIHSTAANLPRCTHAMACLKHAMRWDEQRFGREYDLDRFMIFCADDFNMGAMENKGLNIFNSRLVLADPVSATDDDYASIEGVIGHEYFHNWTGNRITCRDWFQLSLKEGLTVFRDQEFSSDQGSRAVERIAAVDQLRRLQYPEDAGPGAHPVRPDEYREINNFYTPTVYEKGAEVIRMQRALLGDDGFRRGMDLYFDRHDGQAVTCEDFVQSMSDATGVDLTQFRRWYSQAGTPVVDATGAYDAAARTYTLELSQHTQPTPGQPTKLPLHVPIALGLVGKAGNDLPLQLAGEGTPMGTTRVVDLREPTQRYTFVDVNEAPVPSLARGYSAPVKLAFRYTDVELALLAAHDSDPVNRWDAAQRSFANAILALAADVRRQRALVLPPFLTALVGQLAADRVSDPALIALALTPPDPAYVAAMEDAIDVDGVMAAHTFIVRALAGVHRDAFEALYTQHPAPARYSHAQPQAGPRKLRNTALRYLCALDDTRARAMAVAQHDAADNMTDAIGALRAIADSGSIDRDDLFARFEAKWRHDPLVLDKWFAQEAISDRAGTLARVKS
ncbi:MAG: aminopeptidase N, partial [Casimicrobiaceae bacterium]